MYRCVGVFYMRVGAGSPCSSRCERAESSPQILTTILTTTLLQMRASSEQDRECQGGRVTAFATSWLVRIRVECMER